MKRFIATGIALLLGTQPAGAEEVVESSPPVRADAHGLNPPADADVYRLALASRRRGIEYLLENQNPDGSFGSHDPVLAELADFGFQLKNRGSQDGVRIACTALSAQALLELRPRSKRAQAALDRAIEVLLDTDKIAYEPGEGFNTWGYGYKLEFLGQLLRAPEAKGREQRILAAARSCVAGLRKFQLHQGGWSYYAGVLNDFESMSFNTAVFVMALHRMKDEDVGVVPGMVEDAAAIVEAQRVPDGSYLYSSSHIGRGGSILMNLGAGGRAAVCELAMHQVGRSDEDQLARAIDVFRAGENYLEKGRKLIIPHSAPHAVSGYFFFYGYYYAAEAMVRLGERIDRRRWDRHAWQMIRTQEEDGRWWDTASGHYGDKWGTAFALLTLGRYLETLERQMVKEV